MEKKLIFLIICCLLAALIPLLPFSPPADSGKPVPFPGWPQDFWGAHLKPLPFSKLERDFYQGFPGKAGKFQAGNREIILRFVTGVTRKMHPAVECFRGAGYQVTYLPLTVDRAKNRWGAFAAERGELKFVVEERIYDLKGQNWTDVSSWYWEALLGKTVPPWWGVTVIRVK